MFSVCGGGIDTVVDLCLVYKCGVVDTAVDDLLKVVEKIGVVCDICSVEWGAVVGWHGTVMFVQHLNLNL